MGAIDSQPLRPDQTTRSTLQALTSAALLLPGLAVPSAQAAEADANSVSIQYNRYTEGERDLINISSGLDPMSIEVFRASTNLQLTDRVSFTLSYTQDTWSGATPVTTSPLASNPNRAILKNTAEGVVTVGASPFATTQVLLNHDRTPLIDDPQSGLIEDPRNVLVLSSASPESRDQIEFQLGYDWDLSVLNIGGGFSFENDYESAYANIAGRIDLNQQLTSISFGAGYTMNEISAILDPDFTPYLTTTAHQDRIRRVKDSDVLFDDNQELSLSLGLTQVLNQGALIDLGLGFSHTSGFQENPYKATTVLFIDPDKIPAATSSPINSDVRALMEQRPDEHDQLAFSAKYIQYVGPFDAALHLTWEQSSDDWGVDTQAFTIDWVQPLSNGWTITPRVRYYSQDSADFYENYLISEQAFRKIETDSLGRQIWLDASNPETLYFQTNGGEFVSSDGVNADITFIDLLPSFVDFDAGLLPANFSSDHRLSGFGSLSGGISVRKSWSNGISIDAGIEYYDRASNLKLGGDGGSGFVDFDFWVANVSLTVGLDTASRPLQVSMRDSGTSMQSHAQGAHRLPAGVMFGSMLNNPGDFMVGYRYAFARRSGGLLRGTSSVDDLTIVDQACSDTDGCRFVPTFMNMKMHMLNIMYAPTSWMNIVFMPQFMDMDMNLRDLNGRPPPLLETHEHTGIGGHTAGGLSDVVLGGLFKLYNDSTHNLHFGLGVSMPLGSADEEFRRTFRNDGGLIHFAMQLGSGTWDLLPSLTYTGNKGAWSWGAQLSGVDRLSQENESGYRLGDMRKLSGWGGYSFTDRFNVTLRSAYTDVSAIEGDFDEFNARIGPMDFPQNQGGRYLDAGVGLSYSFSGRYMSNMLSLEWMQPIRDHVNGIQRERDGSLAAIWHFSF